jgi:uncharacterized SAM-binding protein YcdF (DUF218 family)
MIKAIFKSLTLAALIGITTILLGYFVYCAVILLWSTDRQDLRAHDAIIVLTGAKGRIETGFQFLLDDKAPDLLISGVINNATINDLIDTNSETLSDEQKRQLRRHCCIDLDHIADTTATNATESAKWINNNDVQSIILVTSVSHMPRAYIQFIFALDKGITITPYPYRPERRLSLVVSPEFWQYAGREYIKFGGTIIRLLQQI